MKRLTLSFRALALGAVLALGALAPAAPAAAADDVVRKAMDDEMARSLSQLKLGGSAPAYYLRYTVTDNDRTSITAKLGGLVHDDRHTDRSARVNARVGSADQDNTNSREYFGGAGAGVTQEDDYAALRRDLWLVSDIEYKHALEALARKKASNAVQSAEKEKVPDFAAAPSIQSVKSRAAPFTDDQRAKLRTLAVGLSRVFREFPTVHNNVVSATVTSVRRRILTSEKTWTDERWSHVHLEIRADTIADDGQSLTSAISFGAYDVAGLPGQDKLEADVRALAKNLSEQRAAPAVEVGTATVLFEGHAAAQLAKLLFANPLSGQPVPRSAGETGQDGSSSFADKLGLAVGPKWLSVVDDPTASSPPGLFGSYDTDDEGVAAEKVTLIDGGVLKSLLMSRTPRKEIPRSNGHGRGSYGIRAMAGNLFVKATGGQGRKELLAKAVQAAGAKGTVYVVQQLSEGSGMGRGQTLQARVAFRYKDGKEEVVRGLSLEGFSPKKMKKDLIAAGKDGNVLSDEGYSPMSVVAPSLLFEDVDVGKPNDKNKRPPLYPSPLAVGPR